MVAQRTLLAGLSLCALLPLLAAPGLAQDPAGPWTGGFARELAGEVIEYDSALPEVRSALLVRSLEAGRWIEWETAPAPAGSDAAGASFVWLFGMDANPERHRFELLLEGEPLLAFHNPAASSLEPWTVDGASGARLALRPTRIDRHGDVFGFAVLSLPAGTVAPGKPLRLRVAGESAGSPIWAMTFRASPRAGARATARDAVRRGDAERPDPWRPVVLEVVHLGDETEADVETTFGAPLRVPLTLGLNRLELPHARVEEPVEETIAVRVRGGPGHELRCRVAPVRPWTVHLVQHTHTDLGYTRPQTEILPDHLRYIDYVLDYCDLTDDLPDDARFRWTCEASWPVAEYLRFRPAAQIERLRRRIAEGRIELTALFANLSELLDERSVAASLEPLRAFRAHGLPCETAMQNDVNGVAWSLADLLPPLGVRYLVMGEHGHRALIPFEHPTAFWWESPSGSRLLAWRPDHYNTGNFWGLHTGRLDTVEPALFRYLEEVAGRGYPYDRIAVQYGGVFLDNAPPGTVACDLIRRWNERYEWPRLRSATASELPRWFEREHGADLPAIRAAWPDWWSDGVGSAPREAAAARAAQAELTAVEGLCALGVLLGAPPAPALQGRIAWARERLVLYGEHTYGAAESVREPLAENTQVQWSEKAAYVWEAVKETALLREAAWGGLRAALPRTDAPIVTVANTLGWRRSGPARVFVDHELLPPGSGLRLLDDAGREVAMQLDAPGHDGSWWIVQAEDVPALGLASYRLEVGERSMRPVEAFDPERFENRFYRIELDPERGALTSLVDLELGLDLVDADAEWGFGQLIHEELGNRWQLERFRLDDFTRSALGPLRVVSTAAGPVWRSVTLQGAGAIAAGADGVELELRLFEGAKRLELRHRVRKRRSYEPEGLYVALPFRLPRTPRAVFETAGGAVDPEEDLIPGTSADWQAVQRFVALGTEGARAIVSSPETPLAQLGGLHLGRFQPRARVERPHVYSWLLNNYWVTNFPASSEGELAWTHVLTSDAGGDSLAPTRFGWGVQVPLLTRVTPPGTEAGTLPPPRGLLELSAPGVLLVGARPAREGRALVLHLREVAGAATDLRVLSPAGAPLPLRTIDALEEPYGEPHRAHEVRPRETLLLRVELDG